MSAMITEASGRYLTERSVRGWLLNRSPVRNVDPKALGNACVYGIGFGARGAAGVREIEDVLIVCHTVVHFVCGVIAGLGQPHVFSKTPLMRGVKPVTRRFAIDLSRKNRLEFIEFVHFDNGATVVFLRHFMHTNEFTLPVITEAVLYDAKGNIIMKAFTEEVAHCPDCDSCQCSCANSNSSTSASAPSMKNRNYLTLELTTSNWSQYVTSFFTSKARRGTTHASMYACTPQANEINVFNAELPTFTEIICGDSHQMRFVQRQALFTLQVDACLSNPYVDTRISPVRPKLDLNNILPTSLALYIPSPAILNAGERKALAIAGVTPPPPTPPEHIPAPEPEPVSIAAQAPVPVLAPVQESVTVPKTIIENSSILADFMAIADVVDSDTSSGVYGELSSGGIRGVGGGGGVSGGGLPDIFIGTPDDNDNRPSATRASISVSATITKRRHGRPRGRPPGRPLAKAQTVQGQEQSQRYECTACGKTFAHTGHLRRHFNSVHRGVRRYKCDTCGLGFFQASHLKSHIRHVHRGEKPWGCELCGQRLSTGNRLRTHLLNVHRMQPGFSCPHPECDKQFVLEADVARHRRRMHRHQHRQQPTAAPVR